MDRSEIQSQLTNVFQNVFQDDEIILSNDFSADSYEPWDSLNHIRLIIDVEQQFNIKFSNSELGVLENVGGLMDLITKKLA